MRRRRAGDVCEKATVALDLLAACRAVLWRKPVTVRMQLQCHARRGELAELSGRHEVKGSPREHGLDVDLEPRGDGAHEGKTLRRREHRIRMPGQAVGKQVPGGAIRKRLPPCETGREPSSATTGSGDRQTR